MIISKLKNFLGDDDIILNPTKIMELLSGISPETIAIFGSTLKNSPRIKNSNSKYYVSPDLWAGDTYPKYVSGGGFVMTKLAADGIYAGFKIF